MLVSLLLSLLLTVGCKLAPEQKSSASAKPSAPESFPLPKEGLPIKAGAEGEMKLEALLNEFSRVTGQNLFIPRDLRPVLQGSATGLIRTVEVPPQEVYSFVENILVSNDLLLAQLSDREPRLLAVYSFTQGSDRGSLRNSSVFVPVQEIPAWSRHPAFLVTTVVDLPSTDVRTLSNSMRTMFTDANTQQIIPVGNTNSLILTGFAPQVAALVSVLASVDEISRKEIERTGAAKPSPAPPKEPVAK